MSVDLSELRSRLDQAMACDRGRLRGAIKGIERLQKEGRPFDRSLEGVERDLTTSITRREQRLQAIPAITYDTALPIVARKDEIAATIREHQVVVICGETGSGKSTQLPKICLEMGRGIDGIIGHTQPRRLAARSIAARVAEELNTPVGQGVGFKIRFTDVTSPKTYIKLMTDGILLAETQGDRSRPGKSKHKVKGKQGVQQHDQPRLSLLEQYDTLIIDEAHERSLNIDFLLGYVKRILPRRPDLRVIITSATLDVERFAEFFGTPEQPAPIIEVSGRTYPVEVRYRPPELNDDDDGEVDWLRATANACEELCAEGPGDILVFMPTERDIRETAKVLGGRTFAGGTTEVLPLFGRLSEGEQNQIFRPHRGRRIVVATNVAESSLTVPGIRYVVDPGLARISRFSPISKVQRLPIEPVSQASADQRKGRCGRIGPGICVRLYSTEDFLARDRFTPPEIQRSNLASVLLQMKALGLGDIQSFPFLDPPTPTAVRSGLKALFELGAVDEQEELTDIGRSLSLLPVDPRIGRMIVAAHSEQCLEEVLIITSALELRDPRERPVDKQSQADAAHAKFEHEASDFLSLLKLWDFFARLDDQLSGGKLRKACHQNFLSYNRMREWRDLHKQLRDIVVDCGLTPGPRRLPNFADEVAQADKHQDRQKESYRASQFEDAVHRALLAGLLSNVALKGEAHEYTGSGGQKLFLWPGSVAFKTKPQWMMAGELVETTRRFARMIAPIQPGWIEQLAPHLVKRNHREPHWHDKSEAAMAWEKVLLFGLPVVARRRCRLGPIDPVKARELFIQHALVEGDYRHQTTAFYQHNLKFKEDLKGLQAKLRQGSLFIGEEAEFNFYDARIPEDVLDGASFEKWRKHAEGTQPQLLYLTRKGLGIEDEESPQDDAFPDHIQIGTMRLPVEYQLEPGTAEDGATVIVPQEGLAQLTAQRLGWLVPGLLEEKVAGLIKTLPKQQRTLFVPVPDAARDIAPQLKFAEGDLVQQLCQVLRRISGEHFQPSDFDIARLPHHLHFNVRIVDANGTVLAKGRQLGDLLKQLSRQTTAALTEVHDEQWHQSGLKEWSWGALPPKVEFERQGIVVVGYPLVLDEGASVGLRLADRSEIAERQTRLGLIRLFLLQEGKKINDQLKWFPKLDQLLMQAMALPEGKQFRSQLAWRIAERCLAHTKEIPRSPGEWNVAVQRGRGQITVAVQDLVAILPVLLDRYRDIRKILSQQQPQALQPLVHDLKQQLDALLTPDFFQSTPWPWLQQYPRYLEGMVYRWEKATTGGFQKDRRAQAELDSHWRRWLSADQALRREASSDWPPLIPVSLQNYRWLLEEYRISVFAQQLKTALPVSAKRLDELWAKHKG